MIYTFLFLYIDTYVYKRVCRVASLLVSWLSHLLNTLRPRQDGRRFPDDIFKCIFFNENVTISIKISLKFVLKARINNIPALVQIMAWRRPGDKPLSGPVMVSLLTQICVTRPQWVNYRYTHKCILVHTHRYRLYTFRYTHTNILLYFIHVFFHRIAFSLHCVDVYIMLIYKWLSAKRLHFQCVSNGDTYKVLMVFHEHRISRSM